MSLSHPSRDLTTLIKYRRVFDQEDVAEDVPDAAVTSVKVEVGEIKNDS